MATLLDLLDTARESPEQLATLLSASHDQSAMLYPDKSIIAIEQSVPLMRLEAGVKRHSINRKGSSMLDHLALTNRISQATDI